MSLSLFAAFALTATAQAAPVADLVTTVSAPVASPVDDWDSWTVSVANTGSRDASSVQLTIQLPETHTSPTVHVLGEVGSIGSSCTQVGTTLSCSLGTIRRGRSKSVGFELALPWSAGALQVDASATTTSREDDGSDNDDSALADIVYPDLVVPATATAYVEHCTGTDLSSFFECELYPSSISDHEQDFLAGGTLSFPLYGPAYGGTWSQPTDDALVFTITELGSPVASFEGNAVDDSSCFEGLTVFSGSSYVSPYRVCF